MTRLFLTHVPPVSQRIVRQLRPDRVFLALGTVFGLLVVFVTLPGEPPDEPFHFYRAYQVSEGRLVSEVEWRRDPATGQPLASRVGGRLPRSLSTFTQEWAQSEFPIDPTTKPSLDKLRFLMVSPLNPEDRVFVRIFQARYPFLTYIPQATAIAIARTFDVSAVLLLYAGRLGNLAAWLLLVYAAIRIVPAGHWLLVLLALMPMSLRVASSLSADAMTNGLSFLFMALVLRSALGAGTLVSTKQTIVLSLVAALLCMSKQAYFPLAFLFFLIPPSRFPTKKAYWGSTAGYLAVCMPFCAIALMLAKSASVDSTLDQNIRFILENPADYARILLGGIIWKAYENPYLFETFVGLQGWREPSVLLPGWILTSYFLALIGTALLGGEHPLRLSGLQRLLLAAVFASSIPLVFTLAYLSWSAVGSKGFTVHGRMFIPIALPFLFAIAKATPFSFSRDGTNPGIRVGVTLYATICLATMLSVIVREFYVPTNGLVQNGDFAMWSANSGYPAGWEPDAPSVQWVTEPISPDGSSHVVQQTWSSLDSAAATNRSFGCYINDLKPHSRYRLFVRARNLSKNRIVLSVWEMDGEYAGPPAPYPTARERLALHAAAVPPGPDADFSRYVGEFYTRQGGCVRIFARLDDGATDLPATVQWDLWAVTEMYYGMPWRHFTMRR